jgi:hypothetical protein
MSLWTADHFSAPIGTKREPGVKNSTNREVLEARISGEDRPVTGIGARIVDCYRSKALLPDGPFTLNKQLKLVLPVKVGRQFAIGRLLGQKNGGGEQRILAGFHPLALIKNAIHHVKRTAAQLTARIASEENHGCPW